MEWLAEILAGVGGIAGFLKSAAVWTAILLILGRILPRKVFVGFGIAISTFGRLRLTRPVYEKIEDFVVDRLGGLIDGLNKDD